MRSAREVICISETLKAYCMARYGVPASRMHVVPNGVDPEAFAPLPPDRRIADRFQLQGKLVVGFVGTFQFFWSVPKFVTVIQNVCGQCPDVRFLFVGSGEAGDSIEREGRARGLSQALLFAGDVPAEAVPDWLSVMDVVVCPYRGDYLFYGSPMKVLEYMAAGKPALCAALGQIRDLIADGCNGALFEWDDGAAFQRKLLGLLGDAALRATLGRRARQTIEQGWTWDHQVRRIEGVLERAVRGA
jgi:glycosyltransferase involved in cell wall biosynthesis